MFKIKTYFQVGIWSQNPTTAEILTQTPMDLGATQQIRMCDGKIVIFLFAEVSYNTM